MFSAAVEPNRDAVATAEPLLIRVWELLRSSAPVYAQGVAMLAELLRDGGSPLYWPTARGHLSRQLELIIAGLEGREQSELPPLDPGDPRNWDC